MTTLMLLYIAGGLLLILLSLPLLAEKVPPNPFYGFRVRATLENRETWYAVNRYAARRLILAGGTICVAAPLLRLMPGLSVDAYALVCGVAVLGVLGITLLQSVRYLRSRAGSDRERGKS